ncbi:MAG: glycosyltransferase, partial [Candidatus Bathyarchaeia archaeon]
MNEEQTVASVIRGIPRSMSGVGDVKVLVIDDGSDDETSRETARAGADVILRHKRNLGLGRTFRDGLEEGLRLG